MNTWPEKPKSVVGWLFSFLKKSSPAIREASQLPYIDETLRGSSEEDQQYQQDQQGGRRRRTRKARRAHKRRAATQKNRKQ
jgi:hypothetical protein